MRGHLKRRIRVLEVSYPLFPDRVGNGGLVHGPCGKAILGTVHPSRVSIHLVTVWILVDHRSLK